MKIIEGKPLAEAIYKNLKAEIQKNNLKLTLGVILVWNAPESLRYIAQKEKYAREIGANFAIKKFDISVRQEEIIEQIQTRNKDKNITGYIVQFPLPKHLDESAIITHIDPKKDIDGFHPINQWKILLANTDGLTPCTPSGVMHILDSLDFEYAGKNITIIGRSNIVGKPVAAMAINAWATVSVCNSKTQNLADFTYNADVVIAAAGVPGLITADMVKDTAILIDVGFTIKNGKILGDIDTENFSSASKISVTPVPGGVGRLTVSFLLKNLLKSYYLQK